MNYGFIRISASSLKLKVADVSFNVSMIKEAIDKALEMGVKLLVTPELSVTGYTCADLFFTDVIIKKSEKAVSIIADYIKEKDIVVILGAPVAFYNKIYNCAVVLDNSGVKGIVPKKHLANYNEFYEKRWFASGFDFEFAQPISFAGFDTQIGDMIFDLGQGAVLGRLCFKVLILLRTFRQVTNMCPRHSIGVNLFQTNRQDVFVHMFTAVHLFLKVRLTLCSAGLHLYVKTVQF